MNFLDAITSHAAWKAKLAAAITNEETLDIELIGKDNCCDLGIWLYSDEVKSQEISESYISCVVTHAAFHTEAAKVATLINARHFKEAKTLLEYNSEYAKSSIAVAASLRRMRKEYEK